MNTKCELPSGRMVDIENIIYIGELKEKSTFLTNWETVYYFTVVWAGREQVKFEFNSKEDCVVEWENLKLLLKNHTKQLPTTEE